MQDIDEGSYLTLDPDGRHLYAISESSDTNGEGRVYVYQIHSDGKLGLLNSQKPIVTPINKKIIIRIEY